MAPGRANPRQGLTADLDLAVLSARVVVDDPADRPATALGIRDGLIACVGDDAAVRALCGRRTRIVDARGTCVVPGLVDAHQHPFWGARATRCADLTAAADPGSVRDAVAAEARRAGPGAWVLGHGLSRAMFAAGEVDAARLGAWAGGAPVFATFTDGHGALASPEALRRAGVDGPRDLPDASEIVCAGGVPTGELREPTAMEVVRSAIPPLAPAARRERYAAVLARMAGLGLTQLHVMDSDPDVLGDLQALEAADRLPVRIVLAMWLQPHMTLAEMRDALPGHGRRGRLWRSGAVKFFLDGVVSGGTAWLAEPDLRGRRGGPFWEDLDHHAAAVRLHAAAGIACVTHAIGDRAAAHVLDLYAAHPPVPARTGGHRTRHRLEHAELVPEARVADFGRLDVVASMQPVHVAGAGELGGLLDPDRAARAWPCAAIAANGGVLAFGSDWPVADADPLLGMAWAALRRPPGRPDAPVHAPGERVSPADALRAYTRGAAHAVGEEHRGGVLAPGMRADLTVLGADPLAVPADDLPSVGVRATIVDGRMVHDDLT